ncbi:unnamed protein product [Rhizoctonia solani]|uniref:T6SS Phospholipase effector Tle1-like catalytic domain-containing protein n=1 Tax=Rhizoctonia solani TaxID=456999 RepID=A0A8H2Y095_9AGAM|nr:unnamed protein product [Rhizoctonia solani]
MPGPVSFLTPEQSARIDDGSDIVVYTTSPVLGPIDLPQELIKPPSPRSRHPRAAVKSRTSFPQVIPPESPRRSRTLVLCFDGTGDEYDQDNSNIVQFVHLLNKDNSDNQMVYYQAGIGTRCKHFITPIGVAISKAADMAIAHGLQDHVTDGYEFLMQNHRDGDKVCVFVTVLQAALTEAFGTEL